MTKNTASELSHGQTLVDNKNTWAELSILEGAMCVRHALMLL
jgi:hypothetical protein